MSKSFKFNTGFVAPKTGIIYMLPSNADKIIALDPSDDTLTFVSGDVGSGTFKYSSGFVDKDSGTIVGLPYNSDKLLTLRLPCLACKKGTFALPGSETCEQAPKGTFCENQGMTFCPPCDSGKMESKLCI